jgi:hypothetical protein
MPSCKVCKKACKTVRGLDLHYDQRTFCRCSRDMTVNQYTTLLGIPQKTRRSKHSRRHTARRHTGEVDQGGKKCAEAVAVIETVADSKEEEGKEEQSKIEIVRLQPARDCRPIAEVDEDEMVIDLQESDGMETVGIPTEDCPPYFDNCHR